MPDEDPIHVYPTAGGHVVEPGFTCWCNPDHVCSDCQATGPCLCVDRVDVVVHKHLA